MARAPGIWRKSVAARTKEDGPELCPGPYLRKSEAMIRVSGSSQVERSEAGGR